jgi:hypothetical protein
MWFKMASLSALSNPSMPAVIARFAKTVLNPVTGWVRT